MNALFRPYSIQNNYLLKKEKNIYVKYLYVRGEHSVLSEANKWVCQVQVPLVPAARGGGGSEAPSSRNH